MSPRSIALLVAIALMLALIWTGITPAIMRADAAKSDV